MLLKMGLRGEARSIVRRNSKNSSNSIQHYCVIYSLLFAAKRVIYSTNKRKGWYYVMMYFKHEKDNGTVEFLPFYEGCAYMHCTHCGRFLPIYDLTEFLADSACGDDVAFYSDVCEECIGEEDLIYEESIQKFRKENCK